MTEPEIVLCGEQSPIANTEPCPLENDHEGEHLCWGEGHIHGSTYGVTVMKHSGERVYHATMEGRSTPEMVCALLALMDAVTAKLPETGGSITGGLLRPPGVDCEPPSRGPSGG